jgi:hypothetical protein
MPIANRSSIQRLSEQIDQLAERLDPTPKQLHLIVDAEVIELLGTGAAHDAVLRRHLEIYPHDARARDVVFIVTGATRSTEGREGADRASGDVLRAVLAQRQLVLPPPDSLQ